MNQDIERAIKDVKRAKLALRQAIDRLKLELPEEVLTEIHYNHRNAKVDDMYKSAKETLLDYRD
jgi:predicted  nucleic acid-binding Zn-ribbon protein